MADSGTMDEVSKICTFAHQLDQCLCDTFGDCLTIMHIVAAGEDGPATRTPPVRDASASDEEPEEDPFLFDLTGVSLTRWRRKTEKLIAMIKAMGQTVPAIEIDDIRQDLVDLEEVQSRGEAHTRKVGELQAILRGLGKTLTPTERKQEAGANASPPGERPRQTKKQVREARFERIEEYLRNNRGDSFAYTMISKAVNIPRTTVARMIGNARKTPDSAPVLSRLLKRIDCEAQRDPRRLPKDDRAKGSLEVGYIADDFRVLDDPC